MTDKHPISPPPPELVQLWWEEAIDLQKIPYTDHIAARAAQWGADEELEACCEWISKHDWTWTSEQDWTWTSAQLRAARRPKPPSLKQQGLDALNKGCFPSDDEIVAIRRALEALPDD